MLLHEVKSRKEYLSSLTNHFSYTDFLASNCVCIYLGVSSYPGRDFLRDFTGRLDGYKITASNCRSKIFFFSPLSKLSITEPHPQPLEVISL